ncbi:MAG: hypothetical protein CL946_07505, partial [Ectothiorhodospiraceae bacterium]|nr:hypothetical protein [Ectothiorhodospiraceae bacterium]
MNANSFSAVLLGAAVFLCGSLLFSQSLELQPTRTDGTYRAGEPVAYTLTARDIHGNIFRNWDEIGSTVTITLRNSTANTDDIE